MGSHEREGRFVTASVWTSPSRGCSVVEAFDETIDNHGRRALIRVEELRVIDALVCRGLSQGATNVLGLG